MEEDNDSNNSENMDDSDEDFNDSQPSSSKNQLNLAQLKTNSKDLDLLQPKQKRKRKEGRRRIRKILSQEQLDSETVSAQKEEQERLRRLELQKSLNTVSSLPVPQSTPPSVKSTPSLDTTKVPNQSVLVTVPKKVTDAIIVIDDSDDDCDVVEASRSSSDCVIEISDTESEPTDEDDEADVEPETSGSHTNDDVNQPDVHGRVLVNVNHPPSEPDIFLTSHLCRTVKPHQIGGIRFLYDNLVESLSRYQVSPGFGCILAHSMGLGKTLQVICFIDVFLRYTEATKVLCIVPMNTIQNWYNEFNTWLPEASPDKRSAQQKEGETSMEVDAADEKQGRKFRVFLFSDSVKTTVARSALIAKWEKQGGVLLMGYEMYRILAMYTPSLVNNTKLTSSKRKRTNTSTTEVIDLDEEEKNMDLLLEIQKRLCKPGPDLVVCDEGHRIKNSQANISQALKKIHTRRRVVLTGYPLQNNLMEYWCMVDFVRPNFLGTRHEFSNMFERPIVNGQCVDSTASDIKLMRFRAHVLHSLLEGFVQRRSEAVLTKTLPEKEEYVIPVKMTGIQISLYQAFVNSVKSYVGYINPIKAFGICIKIWNHPDILKSYLDSKKDGSRNGSPLTVCDPDLDIGVSVSKKAKDPKSDSKQTTVSSEPTLTPPDLKAVTNDSDWFGDLMDNYKLGVLQHGAKMVLLTEIIEKSVQMGDKILVFSQSLSTLSIIEEFLRKRVVPPLPSQLMFQPVHWERNKNYYRLDGGTSSQEREKLISAFNSKSNHSVFLFLLSTRACSLGVNLIGANRVVIFDASWNPCHDAQAVCRNFHYNALELEAIKADFTPVVTSCISEYAYPRWRMPDVFARKYLEKIYRYGQTKKCFIYRLVSHGTFEKRMYERQITKEGMSDRVIDELNPEANLTKQEVMHLFKEASTDEDEDDPDIPTNLFPDPVLNHVCETCRKSIFEIPFKHKVQSSHKPRNILTKAEKREAKKGYEREKRAIDSANKYNSSSMSSSPQVSEQMRKEVTNRPIGHVKPIQNVQATPSSVVRPLFAPLPEPLQPPVNLFRPNLPSMAFLSGLTFPPLLNNRFYQMGELRPLSSYPGNFPMSYPIPNAHDTSMEQGNARQPVMIDLMALPEDRQDLGGASKLEDRNGNVDAEKGDDQVNINGISKVGNTEDLQPQSLCDTSNSLNGARCDLSQSTSGAAKLSEPSVVPDSGSVGNLREVVKNFTTVSESSLQLPLVKSNANDREKPSSVTNAVVGRIANAEASPLTNNGCRMETKGLPRDPLIATNLDHQSNNPSKSASNTVEQYTEKPQVTAVSGETVASIGKSETSSYHAGQSEENFVLLTSESPTKRAANVPLGVDEN